VNLILFEPHEIETRAGMLYGELAPRDPRAVHLLKTLHKTAGDTFDAGIIEGNRGRGLLVSAAAPVVITLTLNAPPPPRLPVHLGVGFARPIQLRRILREAANFGLETTSFFGTDLGERSYRQTTLLEDGGARAALIEGATEARDTRFPAVSRFANLAAWLAAPKPPCRRIALDNVRPHGSFLAAAAPSPEKTAYTLAVGGERGWSDRERQQLEAAGFTRLSIGDRALRTETACIAAVVLAMGGIYGFCGGSRGIATQIRPLTPDRRYA
jgi:RsmE family RNA methyltransferase